MTFLVLLAAAFAGLFAHWIKKWGRGETDAGFIDYMKENRKHSIGSVSAIFASVVSMYTIGDVVLTGQAAATAFMAGYVLDSAINKAPS